MKKLQYFHQKPQVSPTQNDKFLEILWPGESLVFEIHWHWIYYVIPALTYLAVIGAILLIYRIIFTWRSRILLTTHRVIGRFGLIRPRKIEIKNTDIIEFKLIQNRLDRHLNCGILKLKTIDDEFAFTLKISNASNFVKNARVLFKNARVFDCND